MDEKDVIIRVEKDGSKTYIPKSLAGELSLSASDGVARVVIVVAIALALVALAGVFVAQVSNCAVLNTLFSTFGFPTLTFRECVAETARILFNLPKWW